MAKQRHKDKPEQILRFAQNDDAIKSTK